MKYGAIAILTFLLFYGATNKVQAAGILFEDHFDHDSLVNWEVVRNQQWTDPIQPCLNQNQTAKWLVKNGHLEMSIDGPPCITEIVPRFLDLTNIHKYQVDFDLTLKGTSQADRYVLFSWKDEKNSYNIQLFNQTVIAEKVVNNAYETLENSDRYPFVSDITYHISIQFLDRQHFIFKVNDQVNLDMFDSPHTYTGSSTVGLEAGVITLPQSQTYFDNFVVRSLDPGINLDLPPLKQSDPLWADEEYDTAKKWATQTGISTWGCSLTSMVMIMRYYGLFFLPNDAYLTPASLNVWLKSQPDGYVGQGSLNWLAVTRLTRLIHDKFKTPKLEFRKLAGDMENAKSEIKHQRPVILKIPGHFLVADGVTSDENDLLIKDPDYPYTQFSQHQKSLLAVETFIPSFTDLSYFFLTSPPGLNVSLMNEKGIAVAEFEGEAEYLQSAQSSSPIWVQHFFAKPTDGTYILQISAQSQGEYPIQFFTYDQTGSFTDLSQTTYFSAEPKYFVVTYVKDQPSSISPIIDFGTFRQDLNIGQQFTQFSSESEGKILDQEAEFAEFSGLARQKRYLLQLQALLLHFSANMSAEIYLILANDLSGINQQLNVIISR